jgi:hypothetical protein
MTGIWFQVALIFGLALIAAMIAARFRISTALTRNYHRHVRADAFRRDGRR